MNINYLKFEKDIKKSKISPFYVITGKEPFFKAAVIELIKKKLGEDTVFYKEYNADSNFNFNSIASDLYSDALFDDFNLIVLKSADSVLKDIESFLTRFFKNPPESSVFIIELTKLDQRTKCAKFIEKNAIIIKCDSLSDRVYGSGYQGSELARWIKSRVESLGKSINLDVANLLIEYIGSNVSDLDLQIQKISLFVKDRKEITDKDIKDIVKQTKRMNVFDFTDALTEGNLKKSIKLCRELFSRGVVSQSGQVVNAPNAIALQLLRLIHFRLKQIWKIKNGNVESIPPFVVNKIRHLAHKFSREHLANIWKFLLEKEISLKSSNHPPDFAIEELVYFICNKELF